MACGTPPLNKETGLSISDLKETDLFPSHGVSTGLGPGS